MTCLLVSHNNTRARGDVYSQNFLDRGPDALIKSFESLKSTSEVDTSALALREDGAAGLGGVASEQTC
jgi:hypothetical protein